MKRNISKKVQNIVVIGLFAAICYVAIMLFRIPYPAPVGNPFIHFGNLFVILCALLFGGWQGGLAGSIGMGLYDIMTGYGWASIKTVILKFGIGLVCGLIAYYGRRHPERSPKRAVLLTAVVSGLVGGALLVAKYCLPSFKDMSELAYVFLLILAVIAAVVFAFTGKLKNQAQFAFIGACAGIGFNVIGEFAAGIVMKSLAGSTVAAAAVASVISLPATFINGVFSIVGAVLFYIPLSHALPRIGFEL